MAKIESALAQMTTENTAGGGVLLSEIHPFVQWQIAGWPDRLDAAGKIAARMAGVPNAPGPGRADTGSSATVLRVEPLKWWVCAKADLAAPDIPEDVGMALDLSQSRSWLRLSGESAAQLLNHFLPLDLSPAACPAGTVMSTAMHHVGVTLWRDEDAFNLFLPRSFACALGEMLAESAAQYGVQVDL